MKRIVAWARHREPAVVIGAAAAVTDVAYHVAVDNPAASWQALLPLVAAALIRRYVSPVQPKRKRTAAKR